MSWERGPQSDLPCPCRAGTYTVTLEMDDWCRTRNGRTMNCAQCSNDYVLHTYQAYDSGLPYTAARWVKASAYAEFEKYREQAEILTRHALNIAEERYLRRFLSSFDGISKKRVWEILTQSGKQYPSLGTFYKHVGHEGLEAYLVRQFRQDTAKALTLIGVRDAEIEQAWADAKLKFELAANLIR